MKSCILTVVSFQCLCLWAMGLYYLEMWWWVNTIIVIIILMVIITIIITITIIIIIIIIINNITFVDINNVIIITLNLISIYNSFRLCKIISSWCCENEWGLWILQQFGCVLHVWYGVCKLSLAITDTMDQEAMRNLTHQLTLLCFKANLLLHATFCFNLSVKQHWPLKKVRRLGKAGWNDNENSNKKDNLGSPLSLIFGEQVRHSPLQMCIRMWKKEFLNYFRECCKGKRMINFYVPGWSEKKWSKVSWGFIFLWTLVNESKPSSDVLSRGYHLVPLCYV